MRAPTSLVADAPGGGACLLGNEAIVRGAIEAGVCFVSGYPGTPSSEVTDTFARLAPELGIAFEYSVNEKVALETAFGAALAGARSLCAMKHLGLMAAGDPLSTIPYIGVEAGMVIVSAGDPSCRTSPNEQDQRLIGPMFHVPVLDPSTPAEARELTRLAFEVSEASRQPVLLRPTARVCHSRAHVSFGEVTAGEVKGYRADARRHVPVPANARRMRREIPERMRIAAEMLRAAGTLRLGGDAPVAILAAGAPAATTADLLAARGATGDVALHRLSALWPLPEDDLAELLAGTERLLVVEELSPFLEDALTALCRRRGLGVQIFGKRTGHLPVEFEYEPAVLDRALDRFLGTRAREAGEPAAASPNVAPASSPVAASDAPAASPNAVEVPPRPPSLCPGCGHRAAFFAARTAFPDDQLYFNDIGCYTLGFAEPLGCGHAVLCMGAGLTMAAAVARVTGRRTVGFVGDSTFFHSGIPGLLDAIQQNVSMVAVVLDNEVTAMTGFQPSPPIGAGAPNASIEGVCRALGARHVETVDPYDLEATVAAFRRAHDAEGTSVVVVRRACPVHEARLRQRQELEG